MARNDRKQELQWKVVSTLAGIGGAVIARKVTNALWVSVAPSTAEPPLNPADRDISWKESVQWAVAAGVGAGLGRLVSNRLAAAGWERATGNVPPGVRA